MRKVLFLLMTGLISFETYSQECFLYYPKQPNSRLEYNSYSNDELIGTVVKEFTFQQEESDTLFVFEKAEVFDLQGKSLASTEMKSMCVEGFYYQGNMPTVKIKNLPSELVMAYGGSIWQEWPTKLNVGDTLRGYSTTVNIYFEGTQPAEIISSIILYGLIGAADALITYATTSSLSYYLKSEVFDRRVDAIEAITTIAGTFECYKITSRCLTQTIQNKKHPQIQTSSEESVMSWYSENIGLVKQEKYDGDGNLSSCLLLTNIK